LAASHNAKILEAHNFQLDAIIWKQHPSQLSCGSEFKSSQDLEKFLQDHPLLSHLKEILENGASFPLLPMSEDEYKTDIDFHIVRGNHKSMEKNHHIISNIITKEIECGFALPLPISIIDNYQRPP
jgi:hypothetical protein